MQVIVSHPLGGSNVYQTALAFYERQWLVEFHTCLYGVMGRRYRSLAELRQATVVVHPIRELIRIGLNRLGFLDASVGHQEWVDWVAKRFDASVSDSITKACQVVYCYEDSALATFRTAENRGVYRIYELPIGHYEEARAVAIAETEREASLRPFWLCLHEKSEKLERKRAEIASANHIICASQYCKKTVLKHVRGPCEVSVVPYGCDVRWESKLWSSDDLHGPLRLVFVGRLDPRKGLHYLFEALEKFPPSSFELTLAGKWVAGFREWLIRRRRVAFVEIGHIGRGDLVDVIRHSHLLVFPSLFEGFGLVLLEAMACGIPVLTTERTGAPDSVEDGKEGFLVRAACCEDIVKVLSLVLDNRRVLADMGMAARKRAVSRSWSEYRRHLADRVSFEVGRTAFGRACG
jgi:glycosyltransferase involved in cell wall biosynthesis